MRLLWTAGWGDAKWVLVWYTPIAPPLSVWLTPCNTKARFFFFMIFSISRCSSPCSKDTHALNKIQRQASTQDNLNFQRQEHPAPPSPAPTRRDRTREFMGSYKKKPNPNQTPKKETEKKKITEIKQICCSQQISSQMTQKSQLRARKESFVTSDPTKPWPKLWLANHHNQEINHTRQEPSHRAKLPDVTNSRFAQARWRLLVTHRIQPSPFQQITQ